MSTITHAPTSVHNGSHGGAHDPASGHHDSPDEVGRRQKLGVILLIVADVAFVLSLVFSYLYLHGLNTEDGWIPADRPHTMSVSFGWIIAAVVVVSWICYRWGERGARNGKVGRIVPASFLATALILVDLVLQVYQMLGATMRVADGSYASAWMALSGYHAFHLVLTMFLGLAVWNRARLGLFATNQWHVKLVGYWWIWVAVSAILTAATTSLVASPHVVP
jgi:heme/copper-type cytochrome/quinol oxidase subunit 3